MVKTLIAAVALWLSILSSAAHAQSSPAHDLLRLVPHEDIAVCIVVSDLRGHAERLRGSVWVKRLEAAPFAQGLLRNNPHWTQIESELRKHLQIEWSELRDEILGDAVVLAYHPATGEREPEHGLLLLHARNPARLASLVIRINEGQKQSGELKELVPLVHDGKQYFRRVEKTKTHFYYLDGGLLAFSGTEAWIRKTIERSRGSEATTFVEQFRRSEADKAPASLWLNPRFIEKEFKEKAANAGAVESLLARSLGSAWQALDGIFVSAHADKNLELRLSLLARLKDMPPHVSKLFGQPSQPSDLWRQFPSDSIVAVAGRIDVPALATTAESLLPAAARDGLLDTWKRSVAAATGLDFAADVLPNVGPDWGFACWPASNPTDLPHFTAAFAVRPGGKALPVDKSLLQAVHLVVSLAVFDFNLKNSGAIRLESVIQDKIQVHYLDDSKFLPEGIRPAFALKNGYLILASSPEAVARFGKDPAAALPANETPLVRMSLAGLAALLDHRREQVISHFAERNGISQHQARDWLRQARALLDHFQSVHLVHRAADGQATWILRIQPK